MNKYLIVVDVQNDFVDGALGTSELSSRETHTSPITLKQTKASISPSSIASKEPMAGRFMKGSLKAIP